MANQFTYQDQQFHTGDTVRLSLSVSEESGKSRTQGFEGIIMGISGRGEGKSILVRRIAVGGVGVERLVPLSSPTLTNIELRTTGGVKRAKLYYLRDRVGKRAIKVKIKDKKISEPKKTAKPARRPTGRSTSKKAAAK